MLFETRGCLACHEHHDFAKAKEYRGEREIVQGPELSRLAQKFDPQRNPRGREWLYSWIKEPTRYNVRTLMPNVFLTPIERRTPTAPSPRPIRWKTSSSTSSIRLILPACKS